MLAEASAMGLSTPDSLPFSYPPRQAIKLVRRSPFVAILPVCFFVLLVGLELLVLGLFKVRVGWSGCMQALGAWWPLQGLCQHYPC